MSIRNEKGDITTGPVLVERIIQGWGMARWAKCLLLCAGYFLCQLGTNLESPEKMEPHIKKCLSLVGLSSLL